jgi:ABC-type glycerol-3-phosphate transport system substrate-binding protein
MFNNKTSQIRCHILDQLEIGTLKAGDRLPGARELAEQLGVSFLKVQQALEGLCRDGILQTVNRRGTYIQKTWQDCVLPENISIFRMRNEFPWLPGIRQIIEGHMPGVRFTGAFPVGAMELKTTFHVQTHWEQYQDLTEILEECYPDLDDFFEQPFEAGRIGGKLVGIPFIFSPRVVFYNPTLFAKANCPLPTDHWTWDDFLTTVRQLGTTLPSDQIVNWHFEPFYWMNFVMRAGGRLIRSDDENPVQIDSPQTRQGLRHFRELGQALGYHEVGNTSRDFKRGQSAMYICERQYVHQMMHAGFDDWQTVSLPMIPGGENISTQATDLLCIHKASTNPEAAMQYIKLMLSPQAQDFIGKEKYGIPIRKSSAFKSIDLTSPRDAIFAREISRISAEYNLDFPHLTQTMVAGIQQMLRENRSIERTTSELAAMARQYMSIWKIAV